MERPAGPCGAGRPDGADAVAQVRGSEDQAQGRNTGREEEAGDNIIVEVGFSPGTQDRAGLWSRQDSYGCFDWSGLSWSLILVTKVTCFQKQSMDH